MEINGQEQIEQKPITSYNSFVEVGGLTVNFQRTCRVPAGQVNSLPAGLGSFPLYKVQDFKSGVPSNWHTEGYFFPMYKSEAMWINLGRHGDPRALIVAAGNINAISGHPFEKAKDLTARTDKSSRARKKDAGLDIRLEEEQNYVVVPTQPWIDGWKAVDGKVYQFVAAEMGSGETVEGQITGEEKYGGVQLVTFGPKPGITLIPKTRPHEFMIGGSYLGGGGLGSKLFMADFGSTSMSMGMKSMSMSRGISLKSSAVQEMGLGRGGEISQHIYPDPYGLKVWEERPTGLCRIYLVSSKDFRQITGHDAPPTPVTYQTYQQQGLPWFDIYDEGYGDTKGSGVFDKLKPVSGGPSKSLVITKPTKEKPKKPSPEVFDIFKQPECKSIKKHKK